MTSGNRPEKIVGKGVIALGRHNDVYDKKSGIGVARVAKDALMARVCTGHCIPSGEHQGMKQNCVGLDV